ncbi:beta-N-acetylhexosaminidase [Bacterioplanes sanyensis]|uniref:Beta-hexosaminidase n=1 Tax=Bacterioplanes sanyensis TaxID=1249553 RepID=A0A222FNE3_9GAMM|nr:beta-N-acetylhexosaminidase [Bacterioplanes sanyensis]ASP40269.1 beta-N-acetylhexosaminidase [Bacterioplanes sanyensis]
MSEHRLNVEAVGVVADLAGLEVREGEWALLQHPMLSGIILFARNYQDPQQLATLCASIHDARPDLLICIDQEGGRVQRCRSGFTLIPPMLTFESLWQQQPEQTLSLVHDTGWLMATELIACGVDVSFAPVLDIEYGRSRVIGDRAFGHDADSVTALASAWIDGMGEAGMMATGKHFPGHGAVVADSHHELPVDERTEAQLQRDWQPFECLIKQRKLSAVMPAHVVYPALDEQHTAGFSPVWLQDVLRKRLGFDGVVFSDDLSMQGAAGAGGYAQRAQLAINAGANALLACNDPQGAQQVLQQAQRSGRPRLDLSTFIAGVEKQKQAQQNRDGQRAKDIRARLSRLNA